MNLFTENHTLKKINEELHDMLQDVKIIGDIDLSQQDLTYIAKKLKNFVDYGYISNLFKKSQAAMTVFIVFCAVYDYDNSFWNHVEDKLGIKIKNNEKKEFVDIFIKILKNYDLPTFSDEGIEGYKYVTPIVDEFVGNDGLLTKAQGIIEDVLNDLESLYQLKNIFFGETFS